MRPFEAAVRVDGIELAVRVADVDRAVVRDGGGGVDLAGPEGVGPLARAVAALERLNAAVNDQLNIVQD